MRRVAESGSETIEACVIGQLVFEILPVQSTYRSDTLRSGAKGPLNASDGKSAQRTIGNLAQRLGVV